MSHRRVPVKARGFDLKGAPKRRKVSGRAAWKHRGERRHFSRVRGTNTKHRPRAGSAALAGFAGVQPPPPSGCNHFISRMFFRRKSPVLHKEAQTVIRITVPWYEPFDVETKYFGTFKIQLASISVEGTSVLQIAGHPVKTKHTPKNVVRQICGLSGAF